MTDTPIENARNLGPLTASELESIGISTLEQLRDLGWETVCIRYAEAYPERLNLNAFTSVIGAIEDRDWRAINSDSKARARELIRRLKHR